MSGAWRALRLSLVAHLEVHVGREPAPDPPGVDQRLSSQIETSHHEGPPELGFRPAGGGS